MDEITDGVVEVTFGVVLAAREYEARRGHLEFRAGRLVGMWVGLHALSSDGG